MMALALVGACVPDTAELDGEVYEICYRGLETRVSRLSDTTARGTVTVGDIDFGRATLDEPRIGLHTLRVDPAAGAPDFAFVDAAHVDVADQRVLDLDPGVASLYGEQPAPSDLLQHVDDDSLALTLTVEGPIPEATWTVVIDACFDVDGVAVSQDAVH